MGAVLLRLFEPPGLRAGPSAHPRSARPEPDRIEEMNGLLLLRPAGARGPDASPREARNTPLVRRELLFLPGVQPHKVKSQIG